MPEAAKRRAKVFTSGSGDNRSPITTTCAWRGSASNSGRLGPVPLRAIVSAIRSSTARPQSGR